MGILARYRVGNAKCTVRDDPPACVPESLRKLDEYEFQKCMDDIARMPGAVERLAEVRKNPEKYAIPVEIIEGPWDEDE